MFAHRFRKQVTYPFCILSFATISLLFMGYHSCFQHYENIIDAGHFLTVHPLVVSEKLEGGGTATPEVADTTLRYPLLWTSSKVSAAIFSEYLALWQHGNRQVLQINDTGPGLANEAPARASRARSMAVNAANGRSNNVAQPTIALHVGTKPWVIASRYWRVVRISRLLPSGCCTSSGLTTRQRQRLVEQPAHFRPPERRHGNAADELKRLI